MSSQYKLTRRNAIKLLGSATLTSSGVVGTASGDPNQKVVVSKGQAKKIASAEKDSIAARFDEFNDWEHDVVGKPTMLYSPKDTSHGRKHERSVYIFPVRSENENNGYITVSARTNWPRVLEFTKAMPPTSRIEDAKRSAGSRGFGPGQKLVFGRGAAYGLQLQGRNVINLKSGAIGSESEDVIGEIESSQSGRISPDGASTFGNPSGVHLNVPCWNGHNSDSGGGNQHWSNSIGPDRDPWRKWDGCTPIAAAMVIMFHENVSKSNVQKREAWTDWLHRHMRTNKKGYTYTPDIDDGINRFNEGQYDYRGKNHDWLSKPLAKREINRNRPFLLTLQNHKGPRQYDQHTVAVVGYDRGNEFRLIVHDGYSTNPHFINWANWSTWNDCLTTIKK